MSAEALIKRFAPILFLHPQETFVPVDAKRYFENANLWSAASPSLDNKALWGGAATAPFPRAPLVMAGGLRGLDNEPGTMIDDVSLIPAVGNEVFLELGGWKDATELPEAGVTASSSNVYSGRKAIADLFSKTGAHKDARFWYHAEFIDNAHFFNRGTMPMGPDITKLKADLLPANPSMLCYYFFFPAHTQSVSSDTCTDIRAREAACHAGDWQCMAILLDGKPQDDPSTYTPVFFGCTGFACSEDGSTVRPFGEDPENYTAMKVERWRPRSGPAANLPELEANTEHPHLYVALGTHSLYTRPGANVPVFPYDDGPEWCATFDNSTVMPPDWGQPDDHKFLKGLGAFFAKVMGGFLLGGPVGEIAGVVAAAAEGYYPSPSGLDVVGTGDSPDPDKVPTAGSGMTIRPKGVNVASAGSDVEDWAVQQNLRINRRRYDYIVDRNTQHWWPRDDGETGFRGRWGQRVTADFIPRRAGPKFPNHAQMFLMAMSMGDSHHLYDDK